MAEVDVLFESDFVWSGQESERNWITVENAEGNKITKLVVETSKSKLSS